jgi:hypothetical protein
MQRETAKEKAPGRGKAAGAKKATRENTKQANGSGAAAQARLVLLGNGYLPIPVIGKQSFLPGWENNHAYRGHHPWLGAHTSRTRHRDTYARHASHQH